MDENTLANFNNIHSEIMKARLTGLINAINSNQGLYDSELVGNEVKAMQVDIQLRSQRRMLKRRQSENKVKGAAR